MQDIGGGFGGEKSDYQPPGVNVMIFLTAAIQQCDHVGRDLEMTTHYDSASYWQSVTVYWSQAKTRQQLDQLKAEKAVCDEELERAQSRERTLEGSYAQLKAALARRQSTADAIQGVHLRLERRAEEAEQREKALQISYTKLKATFANERASADRWQNEKSELELRLEESHALLRELQEGYGLLEAAAVLLQVPSKQSEITEVSTQALQVECDRLKAIVAAEKITSLEYGARLSRVEARELRLKAENSELLQSMVRLIPFSRRASVTAVSLADLLSEQWGVNNFGGDRLLSRERAARHWTIRLIVRRRCSGNRDEL